MTAAVSGDGGARYRSDRGTAPGTAPLAALLADRPSGAVTLLALYTLGFAFTHAVAGWWGGAGYYSLWFPAAGLRLALLWRAGARYTIPVAIIELVVDVTSGAVVLDRHDWAISVLGVVRPVLAYGLVVAAIRWLVARGQASGSPVCTAPMPFALASVLAPIVAALLALPQALWHPELTGVSTARDVVLSLNAFIIGDLLGVLLLAPPLLWLADHLTGRSPAPIVWPATSTLAEGALVLALGIGSSSLLHWVGLGLQPAPVVLTIAWIGLRLGRVGAWAALFVVAAGALPFTAATTGTAERLELHLGLATIAVTGYLAGSFADAQAVARADLQRRDRLLFQAERLKTLRAMSVAVIHEISQPLSTLSIEAHHLRDLTSSADPEVAEAAALIHAKATNLSDLVRRLRRYGGRAVDEPTPLPLHTLIESVAELARTEMRNAGVTLAAEPVDPAPLIIGQEVELAQAVMNLVRNAAQACGTGGTVTLAVRTNDASARIIVSNLSDGRRQPPAGMGVGTLIARTIVEAHGGTLTRTTDRDGTVRATITLPLVGDSE